MTMNELLTEETKVLRLMITELQEENEKLKQSKDYDALVEQLASEQSIISDMSHELQCLINDNRILEEKVTNYEKILFNINEMTK